MEPGLFPHLLRPAFGPGAVLPDPFLFPPVLKNKDQMIVLRYPDLLQNRQSFFRDLFYPQRFLCDSIQSLLGDLLGRAEGLAPLQISPALPGDAGYVGSAPVMLSAAAADDPARKGIPGGGGLLHVGLFPVGLQRLPGQGPGLPVNDGRVGILDIILWQLAPVHDLLLGQMIRAEGLL